MKCCEYDSAFSPSRLSSGVCCAPGSVGVAAEEKRGEKWWKSCSDPACGSGGWGRTGLTRKVSDLEWQIQSWTEIMWLQGQSLYAWTTATAGVILLTFDSTFGSSGLIILSFLTHKGTKWIEWGCWTGWAHGRVGMNWRRHRAPLLCSVCLSQFWHISSLSSAETEHVLIFFLSIFIDFFFLHHFLHKDAKISFRITALGLLWCLIFTNSNLDFYPSNSGF